jgi:hypothetical protein
MHDAHYGEQLFGIEGPPIPEYQANLNALRTYLLQRFPSLKVHYGMTFVKVASEDGGVINYI